ncbi:Hydrolase_4 domain-containing protein [Meloidogyne graminicola]|uniref:Hydrolase_4 domain-containing protein n=1 Tax=Meloidogyne graminicola TaxID=189291 RepID=A0A8S9ZF35_9BILA|nr:Hydrolase_4 domain-containing protein [Meloidogyne graminicola]
MDNNSSTPPEFIEIGNEKIAVRHRDGNNPDIFWLGGYRSNMLGTKAQALDCWAEKKNISFTRHDYSGHGESTGKYFEGTISKWLNQSLTVFRRYAKNNRQILIGSSLGCWIALRMVMELNKKPPFPISGLLLIAPAPDFTKELMEPRLTVEDKENLKTKGFFEEKSDYFEKNIWQLETLEDAEKNNLVLSSNLTPNCPVHIIYGLKDTSVPLKLVDKLVSVLPKESFVKTIIEDGEHQLSRPEDIEVILRSLDDLIAKESSLN